MSTPVLRRRAEIARKRAIAERKKPRRLQAPAVQFASLPTNRAIDPKPVYKAPLYRAASPPEPQALNAALSPEPKAAEPKAASPVEPVEPVEPVPFRQLLGAKARNAGLIDCNPTAQPRHVASTECNDTTSPNGVPTPFCASRGASVGFCSSAQCRTVADCPQGGRCDDARCVHRLHPATSSWGAADAGVVRRSAWGAILVGLLLLSAYAVLRYLQAPR